MSSISLYVHDILDIPLLTREAERRLADEVIAGNMASRSRMITSNLRLVIRIAKTYLNRGLPFEDLVGFGNLGLITAVDRFDPSFGTRFSTYGMHWIRRAISNALRDDAPLVRVPSHAVRLMAAWRHAANDFRSRNGRDATADEMTEALALKPACARTAELALAACEVYGESVAGKAVAPVPDEMVDAREIRRALNCLTPREHEVVGLLFGLGHEHPLRLIDVARQLGISKQRASQLRARAMDKMRSRDELR